MKLPSKSQSQIALDRAKAIFGNAGPPLHVWERQFDYNDADLERLAKTPQAEIEPSDLWYYFHDLAYVELQPELFNYLFPVCLADWRSTLLNNEPCSHGDSEFHYGVWRGNILKRMLTPLQRDEVFEFLRDSFLERLDEERGFIHSSSTTPAYAWIGRFNSLGLVIPCIDMFWEPWWAMETPGRAVCVLQFCSGLIYAKGQNPLFDSWSPERGGGGPYLWANDGFVHDAGWLPSNIAFLRQTLTLDYVLAKVASAAEKLASEPECQLAKSVMDDAAGNLELIQHRIAELPELLASTDFNSLEGWSE